MSYWVREVGGWLLILIGLIIFWRAYEFLLAKRVFEAVPFTFIGFVVFRGGLHLLKVAVAAQAARAAMAGPAPAAARRPVAAARPVGPTAPKSVLPGPQTGKPPRREPAAAAGNNRK